MPSVFALGWLSEDTLFMFMLSMITLVELAMKKWYVGDCLLQIIFSIVELRVEHRGEPTG